MSWRARPICMDCQRIIHGPGTGVVGPVPCKHTACADGLAYNRDMAHYLNVLAPQCALCLQEASPYNIMRLWADEDEPDEGLEFQ